VKLTLFFKDANLPAKVNFTVLDEIEVRKIPKLAHDTLKERHPEWLKRKFEWKVEYR